MDTPRICLFEPDIPQNTAAVMRTAACLGVPVEIIEPCGFAFDLRKMRRAGMDYLDQVALVRHISWQAFVDQQTESEGRLILATTKAARPYNQFQFQPGDCLLFGRESAGVPDRVHNAADHRIVVPIHPATRSLNLAATVAMITGEALRQLDAFPQQETQQ